MLNIMQSESNYIFDEPSKKDFLRDVFRTLYSDEFRDNVTAAFQVPENEENLGKLLLEYKNHFIRFNGSSKRLTRQAQNEEFKQMVVHESNN
jgi:hypothetical protein